MILTKRESEFCVYYEAEITLDGVWMFGSGQTAKAAIDDLINLIQYNVGRLEEELDTYQGALDALRAEHGNGGS